MSFSDAFLSWYSIVIDTILILAILSFFSLPKQKRSSVYYWLPFLIVVLTVAYESIGSFFLVFREYNAAINAILGNTEHPKYNVWVYNIFNLYIGTLLYLLLIRLYVGKRNKKALNGMILFFLFAIFFLNIFGVQKLYDSQPILFFISASFLIIASGLYFLEFITDEIYIDVNPLRLFSFWQVTFILFFYSMVFLASISQKYLWQNHLSLSASLTYINMILGNIILVVLVLTLAGPSLKWNYEKQPRNG